MRIRELAAEIDLSRLYVVGNKVRDPEEQDLIEEAMAEMRVLTCLPENEELRRSSSRGIPVQDPDLWGAASGILEVISAMGDREA